MVANLSTKLILYRYKILSGFAPDSLTVYYQNTGDLYSSPPAIRRSAMGEAYTMGAAETIATIKIAWGSPRELHSCLLLRAYLIFEMLQPESIPKCCAVSLQRYWSVLHHLLPWTVTQYNLFVD